MILTGAQCKVGFFMEITCEIEGHDPRTECVIRQAPYAFNKAEYSWFRHLTVRERILGRKDADKYERCYQLMQGATTLPLYVRTEDDNL